MNDTHRTPSTAPLAGWALFLIIAIGLLTAAQPAGAVQTKSGPSLTKKLATARPADSADARSKYKGYWESVSYPEDLSLTSVCFVTPDVGWVAGSKHGKGGVILNTRDGGKTWALQYGDPNSLEAGIDQVFFVDETHGWALQEGQRLLATTDGQTWQIIAGSSDWDASIHTYTFVSPTTGFAELGPWTTNVIRKTTDSGRHWYPIFTITGKIEVGGLVRDVVGLPLSIQFVSPSLGYIVANASVYVSDKTCIVATTVDGGANWSVVAQEVGHPEDTFFKDEDEGFTCVYDGYRFYRTTDGGVSWADVGVSACGRIHFADPEVGWSVGNDVLTYTTNGGKTWTSRGLALPATLRDFSFPRRDRAYAVGDNGMIYRYSIVPADYAVKAGIDAPAMPAIQSPLDEQVTELEQEVSDLGSAIDSTPSDGAGEADSAAGEAGESAGTVAAAGDSMATGGSDDGGESWTEAHYASKIQKLQATLTAIGSTIPRFEGKYRNLNLIFVGLQLFSGLTSRGENLESAFRALRMAKDPESAKAAILQFTESVMGLKQAAKAALQQRNTTDPGE